MTITLVDTTVRFRVGSMNRFEYGSLNTPSSFKTILEMFQVGG